jgi:hypothetical protein
MPRPAGVVFSFLDALTSTEHARMECKALKGWLAIMGLKLILPGFAFKPCRCVENMLNGWLIVKRPIAVHHVQCARAGYRRGF